MTPEASLHSFVGITWKKFRTVLPGFINILKDHHGFSYGLSIMNKYRDLLVNRVVLEKQITLISQVFFHILMRYALQIKGWTTSRVGSPCLALSLL